MADDDSYTPLHSAAWHNKVNLIIQLLSTGAKLNVQDSTGSTPLRKAAYRGHTEAVRHLLSMCNWRYASQSKSYIKFKGCDMSFHGNE